MQTTFHFISGLPRSGSTLLSGILQQNPDFHAGMTSPVATLIHGVLEQMGAGSEFYSHFNEEKRRRIFKAIIDAYYEDVSRPVIFDTNRIWTARLHQLTEIYDDFKVICLVRNPAWIMDSFEKVYRKNPFDYSKMFTAANRATIYSRCESLMSGVTGLAMTALKEAFYGEYSEQLLLVEYDLLAQHPENTMKLIYRFLGRDYYDHDFDNVEYSHDEFDQSLGVKGLHTVQRKVEFKPRRTILPPDLFQKYSDLAFWRDTSGSAASVIAPKSNNSLQPNHTT
ncbi:sulfotransferase family protein [Rhodohalobacter sp. 614A]|uniref:sulfotransferase family protein n=1 Tax=Rhodohalobacter sp. 614A TaxID=2908649 RepID=UPI001F2D0A7F|nr:sulfotransferase [Rhodohalobacter sp. 614A]